MCSCCVFFLVFVYSLTHNSQFIARSIPLTFTVASSTFLRFRIETVCVSFSCIYFTWRSPWRSLFLLVIDRQIQPNKLPPASVYRLDIFRRKATRELTNTHTHAHRASELFFGTVNPMTLITSFVPIFFSLASFRLMSQLTNRFAPNNTNNNGPP